MHELKTLLQAGLFCLVLEAAGFWLEKRVDGATVGEGLPSAKFAAGRFACGMAAILVILTAIASLGFYSTFAFVIFGLVCLVARFRVVDWRGANWPATAPSALGLWATMAVGAAVLPSFWIACNPTVLFDSAVYHLTWPRLYLEHGGFRTVEPTGLTNIWPHGFQLLYGPALLIGGPAVAKVLHLLCGVAVCWALWTAGREAETELGGYLAQLAFLAHGVVLFEMSVAYVDLAHALFLFVSFLYLERARRRDLPPGDLMMAGLAASGAVGTKLTGIVFLASLLFSWVALLRTTTLPRRLACQRLSVYFFTPVLAVALFWSLRAWYQTGNPVYPFFWSFFGGSDWSAELQAQLHAWNQSIGMGRSAFDYLLLPLRIFTSGGPGYAHFDGSLAAYQWLLAPAAFWAARRPGLARQALLAWGVFFSLWAIGSQQMRLLIPGLPFYALAVGLGCAELVQRFLPSPRQQLGAVLGVTLLWGADFTQRHQEWIAKGWQHARIYRDARFVADPASANPPWVAAVAALPVDAKLLMLNTNEGFYCPRPFVADSAFEASQISDWLANRSVDEIAAALEGRAITHVLFFNQRRPVTYPPALFALLRNPAHSRPIWQSADQRWTLFALAANTN